jgi:Xaa-Pro aminopeptidase
LLEDSGAAALRLRAGDWTAWATAGAIEAGLLEGDCAGPEVLVTRDEAVILTDETDAARLREARCVPGFTLHGSPWAQLELRERYVLGSAAGGAILSDRPHGLEQPLPQALHQRRLVLQPGEQARYRQLGRDAAMAMTEVMRAAQPDWSERALAAAGAAALIRRGLAPLMVRAAGEGSLAPLPGAQAGAQSGAQSGARPGNQTGDQPGDGRIGARAMLAFSARRHGLVVSLTRCLAFGSAPPAQDALLALEATGLDAVKPGNSLAAVYHALAAAYRHADQADAIDRAPQGGLCGYLAQERVATPSTATALEAGMALTLNPGFAGLHIADTFLLGPQGLDNLTCDPQWPAVTLQGRPRPLWLEKN